MITPHYTVHGQTFKIKEVLKACGFRWNGVAWTRTEGTSDYMGRTAAESAVALQKALEEYDNDQVEIVFVNAEGKEAPL